MDGVVPVVGPICELVHRRSYNWIKVLTFTSAGHQEQRIGTAPAGLSDDRWRPTDPAFEGWVTVILRAFRTCRTGPRAGSLCG